MNNEDRKLIFSNLLNGVEMPAICQAFHTTEQQVKDVYNLVIERIKLARFKSQMPFIKLETLEDAKQNRFELLKLVEELEQYLAVVPKQRIVTQPYMVK